jgi:hypothetical protein
VPNPEPRFTAAEYADRLARTRKAMEASGIENCEETYQS